LLRGSARFLTRSATRNATGPAGRVLYGVTSKSSAAAGLLAKAIHTSPRMGESCDCRRSLVGPSSTKSTIAREEVAMSHVFLLSLRQLRTGTPRDADIETGSRVKSSPVSSP